MNAKYFIFYSEFLGKTVRDNHHRRIGSLKDIVMKINGEIYPRATALIVKRGLLAKQYARVEWDSVAVVDDYIKLKVDANQLSFQKDLPKYNFGLCADILDQQIVDIDNRKVVRVNDIHMLKVECQLYLAHMDVGTRGLIRRLEWLSWVDRVVKFFSPHSAFLSQEDFISWKNAQVLSVGRVKNVVRLDVDRSKLSQIHPTELADIIEDLDKYEKSHLFKTFDVELQRKVFTNLTNLKQAELIELLEDKEAVNLLENIPSDEAADVLLRLSMKKNRQLMKLMETKTSKKLSKLIGFSNNSAGGLMTTEYLSLPQSALVKDAIQKIKENTGQPGNIYYLYIIDEQNKLVGATALRSFINANPEDPIMPYCFSHKIFVRTDDGVAKVALLLEKYKVTVIPVVNEENVLQGVINIDDVLEELIAAVWSKYKGKL